MTIITESNQQIKPFVRLLTGETIIAETPADLWPILAERLADGSPFQTARGAFQGSELLAKLENINYTLSIAGDKMLRLRATTQTEFLGSLAIAKRIGRGHYEPLTYQEEFDRWLDSLDNQPIPFMGEPGRGSEPVSEA